MDVRDDAGDAPLPADFLPLRLVLQASGAIVELSRPDMILGRHSEADIRLPLPDVSRRHCRFFFREGAWHVRDLKSLNGTFVNDREIEETLLCQGDTLRVGSFVFAVEVGSARPARDMILSISRVLPPTAEIPPSRRAG